MPHPRPGQCPSDPKEPGNIEFIISIMIGKLFFGADKGKITCFNLYYLTFN